MVGLSARKEGLGESQGLQLFLLAAIMIVV